ncbi:MAG: hypothetical protein ACM3S1_04265 [Hyphomicrobiales bacterium]
MLGDSGDDHFVSLAVWDADMRLLGCIDLDTTVDPRELPNVVPLEFVDDCGAESLTTIRSWDAAR